MPEFRILLDENIDKALKEQLGKYQIFVIRVLDVLPSGTNDDDLLEYAYQESYSILTHDQRITQHIQKRIKSGKDHCGVFIAGENLQGKKGIGQIVEFIADYAALIEANAASLADDIYNQVIYIH